jgi:hypothetical protein
MAASKQLSPNVLAFNDERSFAIDPVIYLNGAVTLRGRSQMSQGDVSTTAEKMQPITT